VTLYQFPLVGWSPQAGICPLFVAAGGGNLELLQLLIDKGPLLDQQNKVSMKSLIRRSHVLNQFVQLWDSFYAGNRWCLQQL
jgi:hypothetical protein